MDLRVRLRRWIDAIRADAEGDEAPRQLRRRIVVAVTLVVGAVLLGLSLTSEPGDTSFYPLTIALALVWVIGAVAGGPIRWGDFGPAEQPRKASAAAALGVMVGVAMGGCFVVGAAVTRFIPPLADLVGRVLALADGQNLALIAVITLGNGVAEELFFRGAVFTAARPYRPILVSTAIYVVVTLASGNVMLAFAGIIVGGVCAILRRATGGVAAPIGAHVAWSAIVLFALPPIIG